MKYKEINIVTEIENVYDDWADVIVTLDNGFSYVIVVATPEYLISLMNETNQNFLEPGENFIIVKKLNPKIIEESVKAFVEENEAYWLKLHHFAADIDIDIFDKLQKSQNEEDGELEKELDGLANS